MVDKTIMPVLGSDGKAIMDPKTRRPKVVKATDSHLYPDGAVIFRMRSGENVCGRIMLATENLFAVEELGGAVITLNRVAIDWFRVREVEKHG